VQEHGRSLRQGYGPRVAQRRVQVKKRVRIASLRPRNSRLGALLRRAHKGKRGPVAGMFNADTEWIGGGEPDHNSIKSLRPGYDCGQWRS